MRELDCTTVIVLHDLNLAARFCDRVALLADGRVVAAGAPGEVLTPERIAPIYHLHVERIDHRGRPCLLFDPADTTTGTTDGRSADDTG